MEDGLKIHNKPPKQKLMLRIQRTNGIFILQVVVPLEWTVRQVVWVLKIKRFMLTGCLKKIF